MQIVLKNNRVMAHGGEYLTLGSTVLDISSGKTYINATLAECENCPPDIDSVGYEYHAGEFVPCAPFGIGNGNVAVVCGEDCKSIKDSGLSIGQMGLIESLSYTGTGTYTNSFDDYYQRYNTLTFNMVPYLVIVRCTATQSIAIITPLGGAVFRRKANADYKITYAEMEVITSRINGNTIDWCASTAESQLNVAGAQYDVTAFGKWEG